MQTEPGQKDGRIIWQPDCLSGEYLPATVIGREEQEQQLEVCLSPMMNGEPAVNAWLHGAPGTGKTLVARALAARLCGERPGRFAFYINCWERRSLYAVVQAMADSLKVLGADAQDTNVKLDRIRQVTRNRPVVVILDDIDTVAPAERERVIHALLSLPRIGVICISETADALRALQERTRSRLSPVLIHFGRYGAGELEGILFDRAKSSFLPDTWSRPILRELAKRAGGDARTAIQGLRQAAVTAESQGRQRLDAGDIPHGVADSSTIRRNERSNALSHHERLIYDLAARKQPILTSDLRRIYEEQCRRAAVQPIARRTFSKYLRNLCHAGLIAIDRTSVAGKGRLVQTHPIQGVKLRPAACPALGRRGTEGVRGLLTIEGEGCA